MVEMESGFEIADVTRGKLVLTVVNWCSSVFPERGCLTVTPKSTSSFGFLALAGVGACLNVTTKKLACCQH